MQNKKIVAPPMPVRESYLKHRKEFTTHIILPMIITTLLGLLAAVLIGLATFQGGGDVARWSAIATIWLVIPIMILLVVILALVGGMVYGLARLLKVMPIYTNLVQAYALYYNAKIVLWTDKIIDPVLSFKAWIEMLTGFFSKGKKE